MPLHAFTCGGCGIRGEEIYRLSDDVPETLPCPKCSGELKRDAPLIQRSPGRWGDQMGKRGVNGTYDRALKCSYSNYRERDKILRSRGLVPVEDLANGFIEDGLDNLRNEKKADEKLIGDYLANVQKYGGDTVRAMTETMPARDCLAGKFD